MHNMMYYNEIQFMVDKSHDYVFIPHLIVVLI